DGAGGGADEGAGGDATEGGGAFAFALAARPIHARTARAAATETRRTKMDAKGDARRRASRFGELMGDLRRRACANRVPRGDPSVFADFAPVTRWPGHFSAGPGHGAYGRGCVDGLLREIRSVRVETRRKHG